MSTGAKSKRGRGYKLKGGRPRLGDLQSAIDTRIRSPTDDDAIHNSRNSVGGSTDSRNIGGTDGRSRHERQAR
jgi:hypothetical protein